MFEGDSGATDFIFTVSTVSGDPAVGDIQFTFDTVDDTAFVAMDDYIAVAGGSGTIPSGQNSTTILVQANGDVDVEQNERFRVNLSNPVNATISDSQALGTILNDDGDTISIDNVAQAEGNSGTTEFVFTVSVNGGGLAANDISFNVRTADDISANLATAGDDYVSDCRRKWGN